MWVSDSPRVTPANRGWAGIQPRALLPLGSLLFARGDCLPPLATPLCENTQGSEQTHLTSDFLKQGPAPSVAHFQPMRTEEGGPSFRFSFLRTRFMSQKAQACPSGLTDPN